MNQEKLEAMFEAIAKEILFIDTLETRGRDSLDFPEVAVWQLKKAFKMIYEKGLEEGAKK